MNYNQTLEFIHSLGFFSKKPGLERIRELLSLLGNPQNNFRAVHIAGTNGKGSVSAMLSSIYMKAGLRVGLFTSPFIIDFRERIKLCGEMIPKRELVRLAQLVRRQGIELSEFEFITAVAFLYFSQQKCDIAVIEVGLGGRLDATNTLGNVAASVITKISLDHTLILGDTLERIAFEKCGIIKNAPVITSHNQAEEVMRVIRNHTDRLIVPNAQELKISKSDIYGNRFSYFGADFETGLAGVHQIENALIAAETAPICFPDISEECIKEGIRQAFIPARIEVLSRNPLIVLDGAHNPDGARALGEVMKVYSGKITAIVGMLRDKDCEKTLGFIMPHCKNVVAVAVEGTDRSMSAEKLSDILSGFCHSSSAGSYLQAIKIATELSDGGPILIFGSLYLAAGMRPLLLEKN